MHSTAVKTRSVERQLSASLLPNFVFQGRHGSFQCKIRFCASLLEDTSSSKKKCQVQDQLSQSFLAASPSLRPSSSSSVGVASENGVLDGIDDGVK